LRLPIEAGCIEAIEIIGFLLTQIENKYLDSWILHDKKKGKINIEMSKGLLKDLILFNIPYPVTELFGNPQ
jgi:hypothetical protein